MDVTNAQILHNDLILQLLLLVEWGIKIPRDGSKTCMFVCSLLQKGYESPEDEDGVEDVILESEQRQAHVGEDEVLSQEVKDLKELHTKNNTLGMIFKSET